jgi:hypothetical protein
MTDTITYKELNRLPEIEAYLKPYLEDETPEDVTEQLAEEVKEILLNVVRIKEGVERGGQDSAALDELTKAKMLEWDTEQPAFFAAEKVFKRLVCGRGVDALGIYEKIFQQRRDAYSRKQRSLGNQPKRPHPLNELLNGWLDLDPKMTKKGALKRLEKEQGGDVIFWVDKETIYLQNMSYAPVEVSGLSQRLYNLKRVRK